MPSQSQPANLTITNLAAEDCAPISEAFTAQGWHKPLEQYQRYYQETLEGKREVFVAKAAGEFAGYLCLEWLSGYAPFQQAGIPEIVDFNVLIKFQRQGIGTALMDFVEARIASRSAVAGIGVGLTPDYGPAQVLYVRRGYVPDGRGAVWQDQFIHYGDTVTVDDGLVLYLIRKLV